MMKSELFSSRKATDFARAERVVTPTHIVRFRVRGDSNSYHQRLVPRRSALAPFRLSILFIFSGGIFLKLNGRKRGSVGFLLRQEVGVIRSGASDLFNQFCVRG